MSPPISPGSQANQQPGYNQSWGSQQQNYPAAGYTPAQSTHGSQTDAATQAQAQAAVRRPNANTNSPDLSNVDFALFVDDQNQIPPAAQASQSTYSAANQTAGTSSQET
jgi:hypothetical protein